MFPLDLYLLTQRQVLVVEPSSKAEASTPTLSLSPLILTWAHQLSELGCVPSADLLQAIQRLPEETLMDWLVGQLKLVKDWLGVRENQEPLYRDFPMGLIAGEEAARYSAALSHYLTHGSWGGFGTKTPRPLLTVHATPKVVGVATPFLAEQVFHDKLANKGSLNPQDEAFIRWMLKENGSMLGSCFPPKIPQRETQALVGGLLVEAGAMDLAKTVFQTPNDILRLAVSLSDGDVSLSEPTRFKPMSRATRRFILTLLNEGRRLDEEMWQRRGAWIRLGERLHPGEYQNRFPIAARAFNRLRNEKKPLGFGGRVEAAIQSNDVAGLVALLEKRPSELPRRLDHLIRWELAQGVTDASASQILALFESVAKEVATPVLWQLTAHFAKRQEAQTFRSFVPKARGFKLYGMDSGLDALPSDWVAAVLASCESGLQSQYHALAPLRKVYLDEAYHQYAIPMTQRHASTALNVVARGSRLSVKQDHRVIRLFTYWKESDDNSCVDLDLSAVCFDAELNVIDQVAYYQDMGKLTSMVHSGDIREAPEGAAEYIDIPVEALASAGVAYVALNVHSFSGGAFDEIGEAFVGWMGREDAKTGEIFDVRTVENRLDLTSKSHYTCPFIWDVANSEMIWVDAPLPLEENYTNADGTVDLTTLAMKHHLYKTPATLHELITQHVIARGGELVAEESEAELSFGGQTGLSPFAIDVFLGEYL